MKSLFTTIRLLIVLTAANLFFTPAFSQDGGNDPTFNTTDIGSKDGEGANLSIQTTALQSDGKIIIGGEFTTYNGTAINRIARLNADGTLDGSFNPGTGANQYITTAAIQSDGKIIIGGVFTTYNGTAINRIARLNADGTLDGSFDPGTGANSDINTIAIQSDGRIIIGGGFTSYNNTGRNMIARLNADGSLDAGFDPGTGANGMVYTATLQSDGKIIIGGFFTTYNGTARNRIARLNADGTLDGSFDPGTGAIDTDYPLSSFVFTTSIQSDGKILIGGTFTSYNGTAINRIARLNADGTLDASFDPGTGANSTVYTTAIQSDGKILMGGNFTIYNGTAISSIARLNTDGTLDAGFTPGTGTSSTVRTTSIQSDGKIIFGGHFTAYDGTLRGRIARLNTDGTLDGSFNPGTGANSTVYTTAIQSDGKIIIGGTFIAYNGTARSKIARLNTDGTLDAGFNPGSGITGTILTTAIQTDGKIIIGGSFTIYNGTVINRIARLNTDGTLDAGFSPSTGADDTIRTSALQSDGKIVIGGDFTAYNGTAIKGIARLNTDGTLDASFDPGTGANLNSSIQTTAIQSDGKIIIGGDFINFNGTAINRIARLNTDGTLDAGFNPGTGANATVLTTAIQSDGKIIIGGSFTTYNNNSRNRLARLNMDGTLDAGFDIGTGLIITIQTIALQSDGKIIIAGNFVRIYTTIRYRIARLNTNGTLDISFNPGIGANNVIYTTAIQSDGKIIIGGAFTAYNGTGRNRVARVIGGGTVLPISLIDFRATKNGSKTLLAWETASEFNNAWFVVERSADGINMNEVLRLDSKGNSNSLQSYSAIDYTPVPGTNYYRLKQVDTDGKFSYSATRSVKFSAEVENILNIYPNPARDFIKLDLPKSFNNKTAVINITDVSGRILKQWKFTNVQSNNLHLPVAELAGSGYWVQVIAEGEVITTKMIKE